MREDAERRDPGTVCGDGRYYIQDASLRKERLLRQQPTSLLSSFPLPASLPFHTTPAPVRIFHAKLAMAVIQTLKEATGFSKPAGPTYSLTESPSQPYVTGLRGILALESILWIFFQTFVPAIVSSGAHGPTYQHVLRGVFSVPFWNASLISSFFIILSARAICIPFLQNPCAATYAGSLIRRPLRMGISLSIASGLAILILSQLGTAHIDEFKLVLPNESISTPAIPQTALVALNSIFDLFWIVSDFSGQAGNTFWPSATVWCPSLIYYQSYTVYMLMVLLPYTRSRWHTQGLALFTFGSFWLESWGWYSAAGLLLADFATDKSLQAQLRHGFSVVSDIRCPPFISATVLIMAGLAMKYTWTALPQYSNSELTLHPFFHLSDYTTTATFDSADPYPRVDDFLIIIGILILVETLDIAKSMLSTRPLLLLGERSLSKSSVLVLTQFRQRHNTDRFLHRPILYARHRLLDCRHSAFPALARAERFLGGSI